MNSSYNESLVNSQQVNDRITDGDTAQETNEFEEIEAGLLLSSLSQIADIRESIVVNELINREEIIDTEVIRQTESSISSNNNNNNNNSNSNDEFVSTQAMLYEDIIESYPDLLSKKNESLMKKIFGSRQAQEALTEGDHLKAYQAELDSLIGSKEGEYFCKVDGCQITSKKMYNARRHVWRNHYTLVQEKREQIPLMPGAPKIIVPEDHVKCEHIGCKVVVVKSNYSNHSVTEHHGGVPDFDCSSCPKCNKIKYKIYRLINLKRFNQTSNTSKYNYQPELQM
ncbi:hypothetical protein DLAC_10480 [Tieghemostelium lacteum]|uniref:Uncharacterized protein n=1 Tax=Tieghemostelium lacteum TaxID=361077 RepID=A0A151Z4L5_TIELA|nr:hypothetical protein DLAC_10480 [Tieghemostelium lacteum]|eukprot:KYQ88896.1 hypothetical protein DLAC_10480 [Tieghemostelium lacteum]